MTDNAPNALKRSLGLPLLVFYGLGVTVGAGIFALIGEILGLAGNFAPLSFVIAAAVAAATARAVALLAGRYPRAAGEAVYASEGFGPVAGRIAGFGVALTGMISSAVISIAFAGYASLLIPLPSWVIVVALLVAVAGIAVVGVRESIGFAALITILEVGTLAVVAAFGLPLLADPGAWERFLVIPVDRGGLDVTIAAAAVAFFAFIGFEDIVNMAEETEKPEKKIGAAIGITLAVTTLLYVLIAAIAASVPDRAAITGSTAPIADLFHEVSGLPAAPISAIAAIAMINGVLVQVVMASRVFYGMAREGLMPAWLGAVHPRRRTPVRATLVVCLAIAAVALVAPMLGLAQATGYVTLVVFTLVNLSLFRIAGRADWPGNRGQRWWGLLGAILSVGLLLYEIVRRLQPAG
jgi:APA family basic amino acid/polyamine antiporter